jgi:hypothetical protein
MGLLEEVATYLAANSGGTMTLGTNLFIGDMPDDPDHVTAIYETGGMAPDETLGAISVPVWENPRLQVLCRGATYVEARASADIAWKTLVLIVNQNLGSTRYMRVVPVQSPMLAGRDNSLRVLISCNYDVMKAVS